MKHNRLLSSKFTVSLTLLSSPNITKLKKHLGQISMPSDSFFEIWCVNSKIFHWLSIISVSRSFCWPYTPANSKDFIPVAKNEILFHLGIDKSEAKTFLGLLNLEKSPSTKLNNSCHVISSLDQRMSFKNATSASSWPVQAYFPCAGLVKHLKII